MTLSQIAIASAFALIFIGIVYHVTGWTKIYNCYQLWLKRDYWTNYNIIEGLSWLTKAVIIIPGLIFGLKIWWLYFVALLTSLTLIWASNKKLLPTLVGFNTLWVWISCMVLVQSIVPK
jgi:hypothetical protein